MALGPNDGITLAEIRAGRAYYQYDQYNVASTGVKVVQRALHMYGYNLSVDGKFGSVTRAVVKGFQEMNGLPDDGLFDQATLVRLEAWSGVLYEVPQRHPSVKGLRYGLAIVQEGDSGDAVILIRSLLKQSGYACESNGSYDSNLASFVQQFQKKYALDETGIVDQTTFAILEDVPNSTPWLEEGDVRLTPGKLARAGFREIILRPDMVTKLNGALYVYAINTKEKVRHFLAQAMAETVKGTQIQENNFYPGNLEVYDGYYGAGVWQLTGEKNYSAYEEYRHDERILSPQEYAAQWVAIQYPTDSAAWYWRDNVRLNSIIDWDTASDKNAESISKTITLKVVGKNATTADINRRKNYYFQIAAVLV